MPEEIAVEATVSRREAAETLRRLADGVEAGAVQLGADDDAIVVPVEREVDVEVEFEPEEDAVGLEVELTWRDGDASSTPGDETSPSEPDEREAALPVGPTDQRESLARFEVFRDRADEWRWRLVHRNGNVIATSGEGYTRKHNAEKGLRSVMRNAESAEFVDESE